MKLYVWPTPDAEAQIAQIGAWWRENRTKAPTLFKDELERVVAVIAEAPNTGAPYRRRGIPGLRRYRLHKTPYHVYYVPRVEEGDLVVVAVWSSMRKRGPPIRMP